MAVRYATARKQLRIVAAVDPSPELAGKDLGVVCGIEKMGVIVGSDLETAARASKAEVGLLMTVSGLAALESQVACLARSGVHIVSTCEELSFPWIGQPETSARIDEVCRANKVACLGTGVNPGYLMDYLPMVFSAACQRVDHVTVFRVQDASIRRVPFQQKIGVGLSPDQFSKKIHEGVLRHVGLSESIDMIAWRLGWQLSKKTQSLDVVIADREIGSGYRTVEPGFSRGVRQIGRGFIGEREVIMLDFLAAVGEPESYDRIEIQGEPDIKSTIAGGLNGDIATCAIAINAINSIVDAPPGLNTMLSIPAVTYCDRY
jgi:4-hydroxy-tetrahydrodipicolinate reductase